MDFESRYKKLNDKQRQAVDTIDGPVMVIAGPGTGKTELLAMRAANILRKTDALPENILCLTFTEAGSVAMKKRLTSIIGRDAYKISVFTFHAFGSEIMGKYREHFYHGADFQPADDLARHRIVTEILDALPYNDPLRTTMNGDYTLLGDVTNAISDLKRASLTDGELISLLDAAQPTIDAADVALSEVFAQRIGKQTREDLEAAAAKIEALDEEVPQPDVTTFKDALLASLRHALEEADAHPRVTPPLTAWRDAWMSHGKDKKHHLKAYLQQPKLRSLSHAYGVYLQKMQEEELYDYDDMIMNLVHAMKLNDDLRLDLQEKYQYIMVDEFQDTNMAQMRILHHLTDNPVFEGSPNILVVGDDDQAIYGFQGAEVGNIFDFRKKYRGTQNITLTDNYRSVQGVLDGARDVITQAGNRLENRIQELDKHLTAHRDDADSKLEIVNFQTPHDERKWVASSIRALLDADVKAGEISVIARKHDDLVSLVSYLTEAGVPISYERRDNVLDDEAVTVLEQVARIVSAIGEGSYSHANSLLPEMLSHPAWGIEPIVLWDISMQAYHDRKHWLEIMQTHDATRPLMEWLIAASAQSQHLPLERILDILIGNASIDESFTSPFKSYFFSRDDFDGDMSAYSAHLKSLAAIRAKLREHTFDKTTPMLIDFLDYIDECRETRTRITSSRPIGEDSVSVQLLSAHGSKGLEFDHVFILNATDRMWGEKASGKAAGIAFPPHLRLRRNAGDYDERLRLFYVAMTRAKKGLHISYANENDAAKEMLRAAFLHGSTIAEHAETDTAPSEEAAAEHAWYAPVINVPPVTMREYLAPVLKDYKLSATHVNSFIDVTNGGPRSFLLNALLHFPSARSVAASYGTAIHATLQRAHDHMRANGSAQPIEDILHEFEKQIDSMEFTDNERRDVLQRGSDALHAFLSAHHDDFTPEQLAELDFSRQNAYVDDIHLTGKLDVVEFDKDAMTARVIDYKTGSVLPSWDKLDQYQKIKAHKYRQQLMFYKLLVEHSRDWSRYSMKEGVLQFVEPDKQGAIIDLRLASEEITAEEMDRFTRLLAAVWRHIHELSFPDTSTYEPTLKGILAFEDDLLTESVK